MRYTIISSSPDEPQASLFTEKRVRRKEPSVFQIVSPIVLLAFGLILGIALERFHDTPRTSTFHCGEDASISRLNSTSDTIPEVCFSSHVKQKVRHYPEFEAPPPEEESEPIWDALIPDGLGYIIHPDLSPNITVVAVFHQLHCLYLIRRAYYIRSPENQTKDFDTGIARHPHVGHCFDYLRQSLLCAADSSLEPTNERVNGNANWGFEKTCRDYGSVKSWAERWKAFDIGGSFVPFHLEKGEQDGDSHMR
ncbi:hypothetical protein BJX70DRAFT_393255 [Aspergillus crustosus]